MVWEMQMQKYSAKQTSEFAFADFVVLMEGQKKEFRAQSTYGVNVEHTQIIDAGKIKAIVLENMVWSWTAWVKLMQ